MSHPRTRVRTRRPHSENNPEFGSWRRQRAPTRWAGHLPLSIVVGDPVQDRQAPGDDEVAVPAYLATWSAGRPRR
jgi:hypothetical protein